MEKRPARPRAAVVLAVLLVVLLGAAACGFGFLVWQQRTINKLQQDAASCAADIVKSMR